MTGVYMMMIDDYGKFVDSQSSELNTPKISSKKC